jgi:EAL domain-containing protein (putative c-di-GMP-specific phosphodiesterase class I)
MQFVREGAKAAFLDRLETLGLTPDAMQVELTERAAFEEVDAADSILNSLREQGYELALDDFGTGYSSLSYLHRIRCSKIKIDRSFVRDMDRNEGARKLVKAIVDVAHAFGIRTVAEGVETERELDVLRSLGCDFAQGYLLGRPMAAAAFLQLISAEQARQSAGSPA